MRFPALLLALALAAAPLLGGCTLTLGLTGATLDAAAARRPVARYTLDDPPLSGTLVEIVTRSGRSETGQWSGMEGAGAGSTQSVVVLDRARVGRVEVHENQIVQIRGLPKRTNATAPMLLGGLAIDGVIVFSIIRSINNSCAFQGCGDDSY